MSQARASVRRLARVTTVLLTTAAMAFVGVQVANAAPSDGTLDTTFNVGGVGFDREANPKNTNAIAIQADGKILVGGNFTSYNGVTANRLIRLNTDGTIDNTFVTGTGIPTWTVNVIHVLPDGNILVGGSFALYNGETVSNLIKLSSIGALDTAFTSNLGTLVGQVLDIKPLADGNIVATGQFTGGIVKFSASGVKDSTFSTNLGAGFSRSGGGAQTVMRVVQQSSGNLVVVGRFDLFRGNPVATGISSIDSDGNLVASFQTNAVPGLRNASDQEAPGYALVQLSDGKIVVGGSFAKYAGVSAGNIVGLNADGTVNAAFNPSGSGFSSQVDFISVDSNQNLLVSRQSAGTYNDASVTQLARLSSSGTLDASFSAPVASYATLPVSSGDIYVAGAFTSYQGVDVGRFMRLSTAGSPAPTPDPTPEPASDTQPATLANTGANSLATAGIALFLLAAGSALFVVRRRTR